LTKAQPDGLIESPRADQGKGKEGEKPLWGSRSPPLVTSTPARPQEISLKAGQQMNSPDSDYSTDIRDFTSDGRSPISPMSATSGYKSEPSNEHGDHKDYLSPNAHFMSYRSASPGSMSHTSGRESSGSFGSATHRGQGEVNYGKFYKMSFLEKKDGFKRGPSINPVINERQQQHYHRPDSGFSYRKIRTDILKPKKKGTAKQLLGESRRKTEPYRPFKNQDAIQLSKIPDAQRPEDGQVQPIERDDWPSPPDPAAAFPELLRDHRHRRKSSKGSRGDAVDGRASTTSENKENHNGHANHCDEDVYEDDEDDKPPVDPRIEKDIEFLSKIPDSGAARIIMEDLKKKMNLEPQPLDPRSSSRTPSASLEPPYRTRYESSVFASPSRDLEMLARLPSMDDSFMEIKYRTMTPPAAHFLAPRPGYGLKSTTPDSRNGYLSDTMDGYYQTARAHSETRRPESSNAILERNSCHSSQSDMDEYDVNTGLRKHKSRLRSTEDRQTTLFCGRRSVPLIFKIEEPPKIFPYEQLCLSNTNRPQGLDENRLEQHLSKEDFERLFQMTPSEFYHLAEWKRNDMKKRVELFKQLLPN